MSEVDIVRIDPDTRPGRNAWLEMRRHSLGSSEVPVLMGHGYSNQSDWQIWNSKLTAAAEEIDDEPDHLWFGRRLQSSIGEAASMRLGVTFAPGSEHWLHRRHKLGATIDFRAKSPDHRLVILETKNRTSWAMSGEQGPLPHDVIQLACQCFIARAARWELAPQQYIAALIDGQEIQTWPLSLDRLAELEGQIIATARDFWKLVETRSPPPLTPGDLPLWLLQQGPTLDDETLELDGDDALDAAVAAYSQANTIRKMADKDEAKAKAAVIEALGKHRRMITSGHVVTQSRAYIAAATIERKEHIRTTLKVSKRPPIGASDLDAEPAGDVPIIAAG